MDGSALNIGNDETVTAIYACARLARNLRSGDLVIGPWGDATQVRDVLTLPDVVYGTVRFHDGLRFREVRGSWTPETLVAVPPEPARPVDGPSSAAHATR